MEQLKLSSAASLGQKTKMEAILEKKWTVGEDYKGRKAKFRTKDRLLTELELVLGKELEKAQYVLSSVVSELSDEPSFDKLTILSSDITRKRLSLNDASITSVAKVSEK